VTSPVIEQTVESASPTTAATAHTVTLPTATAGQLLIIIADKGSTAATVTDNIGLTELLDENSANGLYIAYRQMDGTESSTGTLTTSANTRLVEVAYRISGAENPATQAPEINGTTASGSSTTPDPPAAVMTGGSKDYLIIVFYGQAGEQADDNTLVTNFPTNYTLGQAEKTCGTVGTNLGGMIGAAARQLTASAENPGTFTSVDNAAWRAQTITIHPSTAVAATRVNVITAGI
jgi:hypothetical protein